MAIKILKPLVIVLGLLSLATFLTHSYFVDRVSSNGNEFSAGVWATPTPTPTDTDKKVDICHTDSGKFPYQLNSISINALPAHLAHGDIYPVPETGCPTSLIGGASAVGGSALVSPSPSPSESPSPSPTPSELPSPIETAEE